MLGIIIHALNINEFEDSETGLPDTLDDDEYGVIDSACVLLGELAGISKDLVWEPMFQFFTQKIQSARWQDQYAGLSGLSSAMSGSNTNGGPSP